MFPGKGKYGYLKGSKVKKLLACLFFAVIILVLVLVAYSKEGSSGNIYFVMAVLTVLPFANFFTVYLAMFPFKSPDKDEYDKVLGSLKGEDPLLDTELALTAPNLKTTFLSYACITQTGITAYAKDPKEDVKKVEKHIEGIMAANGYQVHVKIFTDFSHFIGRVSSMEQLDRSTCEKKYLEMEGVLQNISL